MPEVLRQWWNDPVVSRLAGAGLAVVLIVLVVRLANRSLGRLIGDADARYRARKSVLVLGYIAAFLFIAAVLADRVASLTIAFGVAGAGIAFALQELIASVAGWAAIAFGGSFRVGDRIQLGGIRGDVIDVGLLRCTLMECGQWVNGDLYNGRIVRVANSFVFKEPVFNYSADFPFLWDEITIPVRYGSDHRRARELIVRAVSDVVAQYTDVARQSWRDVVRKYRIEDARVDPLVTLVANDNWIEFTARYVVDYRRRRATRDAIYERLLGEIESTGGSVALASATFELVGSPDLRVRLSDQDSRAPAPVPQRAP